MTPPQDAIDRAFWLAQRYADRKRELAREHGHDREAYTEGKRQFTAAMLSEQGGWGAPR